MHAEFGFSLLKKHVIEKPGVSPSADGDQLTQLDRASWSQLDRLSAFGSSPDKLQFIPPTFETVLLFDPPAKMLEEKRVVKCHKKQTTLLEKTTENLKSALQEMEVMV